MDGDILADPEVVDRLVAALTALAEYDAESAAA
jgi:hypothetical protein